MNTQNKKIIHSSYWKRVWKHFKQSKLNLLGITVIFLLILLALLAPLLANEYPLYTRINGVSYFPILAQSIQTPSYEMGIPFTKIKLKIKSIEIPLPLRTTLPCKLEDLSQFDFQKQNQVYSINTLIPYSPNSYNLEEILLAPSSKHWLGTDDRGRDVASRMLHGARVSMSVGLLAVIIYLSIGVLLGAIAGYFGGIWDLMLSRLIEIMMCFPTLFLILAVLAFVNPSLKNIMIVIGVTGWPGVARIMRGEVLKYREADFVLAAKTYGASWFKILSKHILPNTLAPLLVTASFGIASAILIESTLSFLGFGVQPPTPSWGDILSQSHSYIDIAWWLALFPGIAIFMTITAYNIIGDGLRDSTDPRVSNE